MAFVECPHCEYPFSDDEIWHEDKFPSADGEWKELECPFCDKELYVRLDMEPNFVFTDRDGHEL